MARKKKKGTVVIAGYYGFGNAGDELILLSLIQQIRAKHPAAEITVLSTRPEQTARHFGVNAVNRWNPWAWLGALWNAELFILGGGGLLQESTGPWNHLYYLSQVLVAKCFSCRTEIRAIGVDPIEHWWNRLWTRFIFDYFVNYPSVRDADSQRALETAGVQVRLWRVPDPVFQLTLPPPPSVSTSQDKPAFAWAVASWNERPGWEHDLTLLIQRVAEQHNSRNDLVVFFPEKDLALAQKVASLTGNAVRLRTWQQPEDLLWWIQEYDLVIAMRYHALALAALAGKPFIGWGFQRKVKSLCHHFNQPMWTFERGWDADAVARQIGDVWKRREALRERHRTQISHLIDSPPVSSETARIFVPQA